MLWSWQDRPFHSERASFELGTPSSQRIAPCCQGPRHAGSATCRRQPNLLQLCQSLVLVQVQLYRQDPSSTSPSFTTTSNLVPTATRRGREWASILGRHEMSRHGSRSRTAAGHMESYLPASSPWYCASGPQSTSTSQSTRVLTPVKMWHGGRVQLRGPGDWGLSFWGSLPQK